MYASFMLYSYFAPITYTNILLFAFAFLLIYGAAQWQLDTRWLSTCVSGDFYTRPRVCVLEGTPIKG